MKQQLVLSQKDIGKAIVGYLAAKGYTHESLYVRTKDGQIEAVAYDIKEKQFTEESIIAFMRD